MRELVKQFNEMTVSVGKVFSFIVIIALIAIAYSDILNHMSNENIHMTKEFEFKIIQHLSNEDIHYSKKQEIEFILLKDRVEELEAREIKKHNRQEKEITALKQRYLELLERK